jgi:hypothetical protein
MTTPTAIQERIYQMLTTSTGSHMLDSGGHYGRHWERNQLRTIESFIDEPVATLDESGWFNISTFHHLDNCLRLAGELDAEYVEFTKDSDAGHLEDIEAFIDYIGAISGASVNTYNYDSQLSQVLQYQTFTFNDTEYVALQIHQGADVRGGYTRPVIFECSFEDIAYESARIHCTGSERHPYDYCGNEWLIDGEYFKAAQMYELQSEARKVGVTAYIPCYQCGAPLEGTDSRQKVEA